MTSKEPYERSGGNDFALVPVSQVGPLVGRKDRRAVLGALAELGVTVVKLRGRYYASPRDVLAAIADLAPHRTSAPRTASVMLKPGERLWS